MADTKVEKPKGPIGKLKEAMDDKEEQLAILSTFVRLGILIWSGGILTLNYVTIPGWEQDKIDPTFIEKATQSAPTQTIKLEVPAVKISS